VERDEEKAQAIKAQGLDPYRGGIGSLLWKYSNDFVVVGDVENLLVSIKSVTETDRLLCNLFFLGTHSSHSQHHYGQGTAHDPPLLRRSNWLYSWIVTPR
jgi:hypothetical protein